MYRGRSERRSYEARVGGAASEEPRRAALRMNRQRVFDFLAGERGLLRRMADDGRVSASVRRSHPTAAPLERPGLMLTGLEVPRRAGHAVERVGASVRRSRTRTAALERPGLSPKGHAVERVGVEASARDERSGREVQRAGAGPVGELSPLVVAELDAQGERVVEVRRSLTDRGATAEDPRTGGGHAAGEGGAARGDRRLPRRVDLPAARRHPRPSYCRTSFAVS